MRKKWINNSNTTGRLHRAPRLVCLFVGGMTLAMGGCDTQPIFLPGSGGSDFGTIDDQKGNTYKITEQAGNTVRVDVEGVDGSFTFTIDSDGRLTNVTSEDGSLIDFDYSTNGQVRISGTGTFGGQQVPFDTIVQIDALPGGKLSNRSAESDAPFLVCAILDSFCDGLEDLISQWLPLVLDDLINDNLPTVLQEAGLDPNLITEFPTGDFVVDGIIRFAAGAAIDAKLKPVRDFCVQWQLMRLLDRTPCDG